jgi:hypothetical protein
VTANQRRRARALSSAYDEAVARTPRNLLALGAWSAGPGKADSLVTVLVAFSVNILLAAAKSVAGVGLAAHQLTGSPVPDAVGSILVGVLLAVVAIVLINLNRRFLVGQEADPRLRAATVQALLDAPEVARVTYLRSEVVGPRMVSVVGDVDLTGDETESHVAVRLRALEARLSASPAVAGAVLRLTCHLAAGHLFAA